MKPAALILTCCIAITTAVAGPARAKAAGKPSATASKVCAEQTARRERKDGIPRGLLLAIARTESGRWNAVTKRTRAWPWTVTVNGDGKFYPTKAQAVAEVEILMTKGITNVDVGCMQINMAHHWDSFDTVAEVFDPRSNVAYAAKYLRKMRKETHSWEAAVGRYHSATPELAQRYRLKVMTAWNDIRGIDNSFASNGPTPIQAGGTIQAGYATAQVDTAHMQQLDAAFQARLSAERQAEQDASPSELRRKQLELWREARSSKANLDRLMTERQANLQRKRDELLQKAERLYRKVGFATRRRQALDDWRKRFLTAGSG